MLKPGVVASYLSNFSPSPDFESYIFTDLVLNNKRIEQLAKSMEEGKDVQNADFSFNNIVDINAFKDMQNLVRLNVSNNKVKSLAIFTLDDMFPNLKWLDVSNNKFSDFPAFKVPALEYLDISFNKLEKVNEGWTGHEKLRVIKSVENKFKSLNAFKNLPKLEELYLANNAISVFGGWENLPALRKLHLRKNKIEKINTEEDLPDLPALEYLNLRNNKISTFETLQVFF